MTNDSEMHMVERAVMLGEPSEELMLVLVPPKLSKTFWIISGFASCKTRLKKVTKKT